MSCCNLEKVVAIVVYVTVHFQVLSNNSHPLVSVAPLGISCAP